VRERGRVVEQGKVVDLIARPGTRLHDLCYPPSAPTAGTASPGGRRVELSLVGEHSTRPILTTLARRFGVDAWLLEGSMERVGETRVGRLLFELTGPPEAVDGALGFLREQGLTPAVPHV
jgi:D-methionine transport system ATP-binding protein